jgi:hypothetical protein
MKPFVNATLHIATCATVFLEVSNMNSIHEIVQQVLTTGYLSVSAEEQLRRLLTREYGREDFYAFMKLQQAAMTGRVKQESREMRCLSPSRA